ncbi:MAG: AAA family ATPase [Candidatus Limnocylindria bacterium]
MADEKIRILIVDDIAETRENLAKLIGFEPDMEIAGSADGGPQAIELAKRERPHVILMDINMPDMDGITATEIISNTVPESPIIMMSVQGEQDYLRRSMLAGAREFLVKPFSADELVRAIRHVHELEKVKRARYAAAAPAAAQAHAGSALGPQRGKVITLFSPKGGVGRTTIATNLAVALHQSTGKPVALVDGSLPFGDVAVILNMSPKAKTIADLVGSFDNVDADVLESVLVSHSTGIKVLLAPPTPEATELISGANLKHIFELLRENYAYIVVDTWPSFQEQVLTMLDAADDILVLMTLEITSLKNVRVFMEISEKLEIQDKIQLVANRNDSSGGIKASDVETSLGRKIPHTIVSDGRALVLAVNRGVPFVISHRESQVAKDIYAMADKLSGQGAEATATPTAAKAAPKSGLRFFGAR